MVSLSLLPLYGLVMWLYKGTVVDKNKDFCHNQNNFMTEDYFDKHTNITTIYNDY